MPSRVAEQLEQTGRRRSLDRRRRRTPRSSSRRCRSATSWRPTRRCRPAITSATSPSPKLDNTPAVWISASGQTWAITPAMNVPWPPSKSSVLVASSSGSSSSSIGNRPVGLRNRVTPGGVHRAAVEELVLRPARPVLDDGAQPGVEDEDLRTSAPLDVQPRRRNRGCSAGSAVDSITLRVTPFCVGLGLHDVAEEGHLASPGRRRLRVDCL